LVSNNTRPFLFYLLLPFRAIRIVATTQTFAAAVVFVWFCLCSLHLFPRRSIKSQITKKNVARRETVLFVLSHLRARAPKLRVVGFFFFVLFFVFFSRQSEKEFILFLE